MLFFPIGDVNEEGEKHTSFVNWLLVLACVLVTAYQIYLLNLGPDKLEAFMRLWTFDPQKELSPDFLSLSYMGRAGAVIAELFDFQQGTLVKMIAAGFLHGGLLHLIPNMIGLWILGDNVEYVMGHVRYLLFFVLCVVIATCGQLVFASPGNLNGIIGASGGIFGVAAAYLVYFPRAKIMFFYWFIIFWGRKALSARVMIALYFLSQLSTSISGMGSDYGQVAVWAHVWGFVGGFILCFFFRKGVDSKHAHYQPIASKPPVRHSPWERRPPQQGWGTPDKQGPQGWGQQKKPTDSPWGKRPPQS